MRNPPQYLQHTKIYGCGHTEVHLQVLEGHNPFDREYVADKEFVAMDHFCCFECYDVWRGRYPERGGVLPPWWWLFRLWRLRGRMDYAGVGDCCVKVEERGVLV